MKTANRPAWARARTPVSHHISRSSGNTESTSDAGVGDAGSERSVSGMTDPPYDGLAGR
ncbi:hypothetical protein GCM10027186_00080 [Micromonospora schwarzwaldensis]